MGLYCLGIGSGLGCTEPGATRPGTPLNAAFVAMTVDGARLPTMIEEHPGATIQLVQFQLHLEADGLWSGSGSRRPLGGAVGDTSAFNDNGSYRFDGTTILLHSNFTHTDWPGMLRGDTLAAEIILSVADAPHQVILISSGLSTQ